MTSVFSSRRNPRQTERKSKTCAIYTLIREQNYHKAIEVLNIELTAHPTSRAALSLLGHCFYHVQEFTSCVQVYEPLMRLFPDVVEYRVYLAQCYFKVGMYQQAAQVACTIHSPDPAIQQRMLHLLLQIEYEQDNLHRCKQLIEQLDTQHACDEPDTLVARGCVLYKEGMYEEATDKFQDAKHTLGDQPDLLYNTALCFYKLNNYAGAQKDIAEIVQQGVTEHPELSVGSNVNDLKVRSIGNSLLLQDTRLIEAFNLQLAIEYQLKNDKAARNTLAAMPPRDEHELDSVTLHNQALVNAHTNPTEGLRKLNFLLSCSSSPPPETFGNLLLLYLQHQYLDLAADILAEHMHSHASMLGETLYAYIDAMVLTHRAPADAYRKLDLLAAAHIAVLRTCISKLQVARMSTFSSDTKNALDIALEAYDVALESYIPVLMAQAKLYWDLGNYPVVETLFKQSAEFCSDHPVWRLHVAHVFFMQEKFADAIRYYAPLVEQQQTTAKGSVLNVPAIVLANLCVSYIMTQQNDIAEQVMRKIEVAEDGVTQSYHLCIVNLVIGTLYVAKGGVTFGIKRVIKSLDPYDKTLSIDTWYHVKRCFLALLDACAKHLLIRDDDLVIQVLTCLDAITQHGKDIPTLLPSQQDSHSIDPNVHNVAFEARLLKAMLKKLCA
jgi:tetratricopeptide repeat protein 30